MPTVLILSQDSFYRAHTAEEIEMAFNNDLDLGKFDCYDPNDFCLADLKDHPDAMDSTLFAQVSTL